MLTSTARYRMQPLPVVFHTRKKANKPGQMSGLLKKSTRSRPVFLMATLTRPTS